MFDIGGEGCISGKPEYCDKDHPNYAENSDNRITALAYAGYAATPRKARGVKVLSALGHREIDTQKYDQCDI